MSRRSCASIVALSMLLGAAGQAMGQLDFLGRPGNQVNPVYVDDSPFATDSFVRVREHIAARNLDEAVRVLQVLLDSHFDSVQPTANDANLFVSVRAEVYSLLISTPELLARYRDTLSARADRELAEGKLQEVHQSLLLTPAGLKATLMLAQAALDDARFEHARLLLEQIEQHPDRKTREAAELFRQVAGYLDRPDVRDRAVRWLGEAGVNAAEIRPETWPAAARSIAASPLAKLSAPPADGMVSKPLWTIPLTKDGKTPDAQPPMNPRGSVPVPTYARELLILPTVQDDTVFLSDGTTVSAWDRFTLAPRWSAEPGVGDLPAPEPSIRGDRRRFERFNMGWGGRYDDLCTVAVQGRTVIAATGRATAGNRSSEGDDRVHALDAITGRVKWSVHLSSLDPSLESASVRGPIQIFEGIVVVPARKYVPDRRLVSLSLVGLDLATGTLQWVRPVGSAGSMPWVIQSMGADGSTIADGVVYRADRLGVIGAIEVGSGQTTWIRLMPVDTTSSGEQPAAWQLHRPIIDGETLVLLTPDMRKVIRLDRRTGAILKQRDTSDFSTVGPRYLLRVEDKLVLVGDERVGVVPIAEFETAAMQVSPAMPQPGIRGRVVAAGNALILPTTSGYSVVDVAAPQQVKSVVLDETGNVLPLDSQLVVIDDARAHSYLLWSVAENLLTARIEQNPKDPSPAVTYAELAYRAGHPEKIVGAVQQAMTALKAAPQNDSTWRARARLIDFLQTSLAASLEGGVSKTASQRPIEDRPLLGQLVGLLGEVSFQPEDRLAFELATGRLAELNGGFTDAVAAYQRVLTDAPLAGATWRGPQVSIRGELEAARRIENLLKQHGVGIYAAQEQAAATELAAAGATPTIQQLEQITARYPLAQLTPGVWLKIADLQIAAQNVQSAAMALELGLRSATRQPTPPMDVVGELAGRLIVDLRQRQQLAAAAGVLRSVRTRFNAITLKSGGQTLDAEKLGAEIAERIAASMRWPRVGPVRAENAQPIVGWTLMDPLLIDRTPRVSNLLALESEDACSVWGQGAEGAPNTQNLVKLWSHEFREGENGHLVKMTSDAAYFVVARDTDGFVEKVGGTPVASKWKSKSLTQIFGTSETRGMRRVPGIMADRIATPVEGETSANNLIVAMDDRTLVLVQRGGRAAAIDTDTGDVLWTTRTGVGRVYDCDLSGGMLAIAGDQEVFGPGNTLERLKPVVQVVDARSGRPMQRISDLGGQIRWVSFAESGALLASLESSIVCLDLNTAQPNWTITGDEMMPITAMWTFGDQVVLLDPNRTFWLASVSTGRLRQAALDVPRSHIDATIAFDAFPLAGGNDSGFGIATQQGLAIFSAEGSLVGVDGMDGATNMIKPRPADGRALTIETVAEGRSNDGLMMFALHALDVSVGGGATLLDSRPILLGARPTSMSLMDGRVAVTAGSVTVVLQAPK